MRLGVMYIGWNDRIWRGYDTKRGWTELKGCFSTPSEGSDTVCHRNHIHISLTWDGASGRTSFWDGTPMDGPYCKPARSSASIPDGGRAADMVPVEPVKVLGTRKALGVPERCRLQQDRYSGDSHRVYAKVTGQGAIPATGVAAVAVQVTAMASNAPANVRIWGPGQSKSQVVAKVPMNMDAVGTAVVPVASDGTIALATSAGATDVTLDVVGYYPPGDVPEHDRRDPGRGHADGRRAAAAAAPARTRDPLPHRTAGARRSSPSCRTSSSRSGPRSATSRQPRGRFSRARSASSAWPACPAEATAALVLITTREATKRGKMRIGSPDKDPEATFQFPKKGVRSAVMVVPVVGSQVKFVTSKKAAVQLRVEVLGYALNAKPIKVRSVAATRIVKAKLECRGRTLVVGPVTGVAGLPKKAKKVTGVILQVRTKTKGPDAGSLKVYGLDGTAHRARGRRRSCPGRRTRRWSWPRWAPTARSWCALRPGEGQGDHRRLDPPLTS